MQISQRIRPTLARVIIKVSSVILGDKGGHFSAAAIQASINPGGLGKFFSPTMASPIS